MKDKLAFPKLTNLWEENGLTKRELFAAILWRRELDTRKVLDKDRPIQRAKQAVENADALIIELEKGKE